jgi:hypothetical protein
LLAFGVINTSYGYVEPITLLPWQLSMAAKLDTGAESSSISAQGIHLHKADNGEEYVSFHITHPSLFQSYFYDLPLKGKSPIKSREGEGKADLYAYRPVVEMPFCFDQQQYILNVNLIDRSEFKYPILIGRQTLNRFNADIDSDKKNTIKKC